ncbi:LOW QUALITY PROTEIN: cleavage stimulation factor subunit 2 tau variant [Drosophila tropicalis]|uniref:LOW QUALITY PROTEIN: cleavage stimulation factor subunit 2 tau variant n=1 Tax=Drosophila tropicalis TaxID=46794 RepID=UPI0035AC2705
MAAAVSLVLLLLVGVHGTTIISIKYPQQQTRQVKRDLSLSYAATNIDSKEGTRVKTITVIKNLGGIGTANAEVAGVALPPPNSNRKQQKLAINPALHKNPEWASAFRDNFDSYGSLPDVPDIDDLFEFVNRKKTATSSSSSSSSSSMQNAKPEAPKEEITTKQPAVEPETEPVDSDEAIVEKIKGDAELLPHIKQVNILRLQAQQLLAPQRTRESLINVNYSTPMHQVTQYFDNYVQALPNGYDYSKPCGPAPSPGNSIQVTTPSGRTYDIPQSNSSGTGGGNHPYLAPSLTKKTQIQPQPPILPPAPVLVPNYSSVNSIVPALSPSNQIPLPVPPQTPAPAPAPVPAAAAGAGVGIGIGGGLPPPGLGISTSQRPYVAPRLRNNGLGINRGPATAQPLLPAPPQQPQQGPVFGLASNRPNTLRSRGLKY